MHEQAIELPRGTLGTVRNAMLLLELLDEGAPFQQLTDLAERSELSLPTVHRLLRSLAAAGLVEQLEEEHRVPHRPERAAGNLDRLLVHLRASVQRVRIEVLSFT